MQRIRAHYTVAITFGLSRRTSAILTLAVSLCALAAPGAVTRTWSGLGVNASWSTPGNWVGSVIPQATNDLDFPGGAAQFATQNNYLGAAHSITFGVGGYSIVGASMVLSNGVNSTNTTGANVLAHPVTLGANQSFTNLNPGTSLILTVLDLAGRGATFRGAGTNQVASSILDSIGGGGLTNAGTGIFLLSGSNSFTGPTLLSSGTNIINGFHRRSPITWTAGNLAGTGHLGQVTASGATARQLTPGFGGTGILEASNLVLNSSVTLGMQINGTNAGVDYDQLIVSNGNLTIGSAALSLTFLANLSPAPDTVFTLIKLPNVASTLAGTFTNLPEGSTFTNNDYIYELSYAGGDGNDVTLTTSGYVSTGTLRFWTGAGTNSLWMNRTNWSGNIAPLQGDSLLFQTTASRTTNFNDFPDNTTFGGLRFTGSSGNVLKDTLFGNAIRLNDGVRVETPSGGAKDATGSVVISNRIGLNLSQTFTNDLDTDLRFAGALDLGANTLSVGVRGNTDIYFDAPVAGSGTLNTIGPGRIHLTASNAITGDVFVGGALVFAEHAQALGSGGSGPVRVGANAALRLSASNAVFTGSSLVLTGQLQLSTSPNSGLAAPLLIGGTNALIVMTNGLSSFTNFTLLGPVTNTTQCTISGGGGFVRLAPGAAIQGGGVLRDLGSVDVDGIAHNVVVLGNNNQSCNLSGAGQIDTLISTNFGVLAPGSASDATLAFDPLRVGSLVLGGFTTLQIDLFPNRPGGGSTNASLFTSNAPTLGTNAVLKVTALTNLAPNQQFTILRNNSAAPITNTFKNLPEGGALAATNGNFALRISYAGGSGNDVVLTVLSNTPPIFAATTANLTVNELSSLTYTNVVSDIEKPPQTMTWTLLTPIPGISLNPTNGVLTWTPTEAQGPSTNNVLVQVTDSGSPPLSSTATNIIVVQEINQKPVPVPVSQTNILSGTTLTIQLVANDPDIPVNPLTWLPVSNLVSGASLTTNGLFTYSPSLFDVGLKTNSVKVFDFNADALNPKSMTNTLNFVVGVLMHRIVTNTNDAGPGSLRQALLDSETNSGGCFVEFAIPGAGVQRIAPLTPLPTIGPDTLIDGYTQPGSHANTKTNGTDAQILIELSGENQSGANGLSAFQSGMTVRGLCINRFTGGAGLGLSSCCGSACGANSGIAIEGCFLGTDTSGAIALPNGRGVVFGCTSSSRLGGSDPSQRNLISGNMFDAVQISGNHNNNFLTIQNNLIGTDRTGTNALPNGFCGIVTPNGGVGDPGFFGANNLIADNVISANGQPGQAGVNFGGTANVFVRNRIGVGVDGVTPLGNHDGGIFLFGVGHQVGGTNPADGNIIAYNSGPGVRIASGDLDVAAINHTVLGNSIFANSGLAIDLGNLGRTNNDVGDTDLGPNNLQNFPVLTSVVPTPTTTVLNGSLNSITNTTYRIEVFRSPDFAPANRPQARFLLGFTNVATDAAGNAHFTLIVTQLFSSGIFTATATDPGGNTSEISDGLPFALLNISALSSQVRLSWLTNLTGFVLQSNGNLAISNGWADVPGSPGVINASFFRDFPRSESPRFFRLRLP